MENASLESSPKEARQPTGDEELRAGALRLPGVLMQSITTMAPAVGLLFSLQFIASYAGIVVPLAFVIAFAIMLTLAISVSQLAKHLPNAGGYFTYISHTIGPRMGFITSWLFFLYIPLSVMTAPVFMAGIVNSELSSQYGVDIPWWLIFIATMAIVLVVIYRGIEVSTKALIALGAAEIAIIVALAAWGIFGPGPGGASVAPFDPGHSDANGIYLGVVFSIFAYVGWEAAAPLAEETTEPRRTIPRALILSVIIMGVFFTFSAWGLVLGWGTQNIGSFVKSRELPAFVLGRSFWGHGWILVLLAIVNSTLALSVASANATTRMWFAMARTGSLPRPLARVHPKFKTPTNAIVLLGAVLVPLGLVLGGWLGTDKQYFMMGLMFVIAASWTYIMGNIGVARYYRRERPAEFSPLLHLIFPVLSSCALIWVVYKSVNPLPEAPAQYAPIICGVWFLIGIGVLLALRVRGREGWLLKAGQVAATGDSYLDDEADK